MLEDCSFSMPDTSGCCVDTTPETEAGDASTNELQTPEYIQKGKTKKSSMKSKAHRPRNLKIPKALQQSFTAQSNGNQQAKGMTCSLIETTFSRTLKEFHPNVFVLLFQVSVLLSFLRRKLVVC